MKKILYVKRLLAISLFLCQMGCLTVFSAPASKPQLKKFHNLSVMPHTGKMQYNVELYRIQDADFDLPISITYSCDGFRPFDYSDPVGSGWTLNAGGVITRQIMGDADDLKIIDKSTMGFYSLLKSDIITPSSADEMLAGSDTARYRQYDCQSDIYTFSFAGYSGSFLIDWDGKAVFLSGDFVDVDFSDMTIQEEYTRISTDLLNVIPKSSTILITTFNGWKYTFGGAIEALEYAFVRDHKTCYTPDITAWHLTSIEAPNGRKLSFHYMPITDSDALDQFHMDIGYIANCEYKNYPPFYSDTLDFYKLTQNGTLDYYYSYDFPCWTRTPRLDSITTSEGLLNASFHYTTFSHALYKEKDNHRQKSFLTTLQITANKEEVGNWQFSYGQTTNASKSHWYLTQLQGYDTIAYNFQYNRSPEAPNITELNATDSIDQYGYSISNPTYGLLQQSIEPMGSSTTYAYTPCKYDSLRIFKKTGNQILSVQIPNNERKMLHAQSISSIKVTDAMDQLLVQKSYIYDDAPRMVEGLQMASAASNETFLPPLMQSYDLYGVLNIDYALLNDHAASNSQEQSYLYSLYPVLRLHNPYFTPLEYGKVIEKVQYGNERTPSLTHIYYYDNTIDLYEYDGELDTDHFTDVFPYLLQWERRSKLQHDQEYIGNMNQLKRESYYEYNLFPRTQPKSSDSIIYMPRPPFNKTAMRVGKCNIIIPLVPPAILSTTTYDIETNGTLQQYISYERDAMQRIVRKDIEDGNRHKFVRYTYLDNLLPNTDTGSDIQVEGYAGLMQQHRIDSPVETVSGFVRNGKDYITHGEIMLYKRYGQGTIIPPYNPPPVLSDSVVAMYHAPGFVFPTWYAPAATLSLQTAEPLIDYVPLSIQNGKVCADSRYDTIATYQYNRNLRMTKVIPQNGVPIQYQWDEHGLYCITETAGGQQHSYTYYPYIGIATDTDPRGITTYYAYDSLGRLIEVWRIVDNKKQIINTWKYHYANEQ